MEYWKVVAFTKPGGQLSATGYRQSQSEVRGWVEADLDSRGLRPMSQSRREAVQVSIASLEELTSIDFGDLKTFDPLNLVEATKRNRTIEGLEDIVL